MLDEQTSVIGDTDDVVQHTTTVLRDTLSVLTDQENRLAETLASVREKRVAAERALATFSGDAAPKKRRGRPRKQPETV
jgi:hypothetical protein